jgi:hypothetical protein
MRNKTLQFAIAGYPGVIANAPAKQVCERRGGQEIAYPQPDFVAEVEEGK